MSRHVSPSEQGRLQGANSSLMGLTGLIGPGLFAVIFAHFIAPDTRWHLPGAPFLLAALLVAAALALAATRQLAPDTALPQPQDA
jgi:DHA1 family tetracycline resistance protein-like MFS transporter